MQFSNKVSPDFATTDLICSMQQCASAARSAACDFNVHLNCATKMHSLLHLVHILKKHVIAAEGLLLIKLPIQNASVINP
jgi:hypothetical protein